MIGTGCGQIRGEAANGGGEFRTHVGGQADEAEAERVVSGFSEKVPGLFHTPSSFPGALVGPAISFVTRDDHDTIRTGFGGGQNEAFLHPSSTGKRNENQIHGKIGRRGQGYGRLSGTLAAKHDDSGNVGLARSGTSGQCFESGANLNIRRVFQLDSVHWAFGCAQAAVRTGQRVGEQAASGHAHGGDGADTQAGQADGAPFFVHSQTVDFTDRGFEQEAGLGHGGVDFGGQLHIRIRAARWTQCQNSGKIGSRRKKQNIVRTQITIGADGHAQFTGRGDLTRVRKQWFVQNHQVRAELQIGLSHRVVNVKYRLTIVR